MKRALNMKKQGSKWSADMPQAGRGCAEGLATAPVAGHHTAWHGLCLKETKEKRLEEP